jgi:hypothetical protein
MTAIGMKHPWDPTSSNKVDAFCLISARLFDPSCCLTKLINRRFDSSCHSQVSPGLLSQRTHLWRDRHPVSRELMGSPRDLRGFGQWERQLGVP